MITPDLLGFEQELTEAERTQLAALRAALAEIDDRVVDDAWEASEFPHDLVAPLAAAGCLGNHLRESDEPTFLYRGFATLELARKDASLATFAGVTGSLFGLTVRHFGSDEQRAEILPQIVSGERVGAFGLTEPEHGSDVAGGLTTTARRDGDDWVLNGAKRWIGNATWSDWVIIWAREEGAEGRPRILGFVVPTDTAGYTATKIEGKYSLRTVQNADITLVDVRVPDSARLPGITSFRETGEVLKLTRLEVGWAAVGNALGALDAALTRATERQQFGRPLAEFQLVQDLLVQSKIDIVSALGALVQAARLADRDALSEEQASLVKLLASARARDAVRRCREVFGGDGIVLGGSPMKHFMDAEAIYTFEGTHQINSLIVGRALTGASAFV